MHKMLPALPGYEHIPPRPARAIETTLGRPRRALGPASSIRAIADTVVLPLLHALGFTLRGRSDQRYGCALELGTDGNHPPTSADLTITVIVVAFGAPLSTMWRESVRDGLAVDARWSLCTNGVSLRLVDARRTWSRDYLEFDLAVVAESQATQSVLWSLARAEALSASSPLLDRAVALSARHGVDVCEALGKGVLHALQRVITALSLHGRCRFTPEVLFEHSLTVLYRILFLLFAEARGLVPLWHPVYRDRYSLDVIVTGLLTERRPRGLWKALQAIAQLAHAGCAAGELSVTAFNGRLFAPAEAAAFDRRRVDDTVLADAILAVAATPTGQRRSRIAYRDLDVEQLGAVYERVLDYQAVLDRASVRLLRAGDIRKASGTFYTPRGVTTCLVRQTLDPLVAGLDAEAILNLRILDPAMGSGAVLVAACRYLAAAAEQALMQEGRWHAHDVTPEDRAMLRRQIAARCLFGVDLNPMAVQLGRLSLWLATLSVGKPLTFLDHHLVAGNSLVGATPDDVRRQPSGTGARGRRRMALPLFDESSLSSTLGNSSAVRLALTAQPDDSAGVVRDKERRLATLTAPDGALGRWSRALDLWCAGWFWEHGDRPDARTCGELLNQVLDRGSPHLTPHLAQPLLARADAVAKRHRFLHWPLVFPEVFRDAEGRVLSHAGFDAVIGNPPWDMVRGDSGADKARGERRSDARRLTDFVRQSGVYAIAPRAHINRYQLFVERAMHLVRPGGRIGLVLPAGVVSDAGAAPLRRLLFDRVDVDAVEGLDNREAIFPVHRSLRFVLLSGTAGRPTSRIRCRFGVSRLDELEEPDSNRPGVTIARAFLSRLSGSDDLGIPELRHEIDLRLLERISAMHPRLGEAAGWNVQFGRELNASDDRHAFEPFDAAARARPIVEGKQLDPFRVRIDRSRHQLKSDAVDRIPRRARLAYRDVASATNRLTLIAAIVPARAVTTHTLFCLKSSMTPDAQRVLCGLMNSYVANYLMRFRVNTHVTASLMARLPVPRLAATDQSFARLNALVRTLLEGELHPEEMEEYVQLQALAARLYGLSATDFDHVLSTFSLIPDALRSRVASHFRALTRGAGHVSPA